MGYTAPLVNLGSSGNSSPWLSTSWTFMLYLACLLSTSQLPEHRLGTMPLSFSYLRTVRTYFNTVKYWTHSRKFIYFYTRYISLYAVSYNSLAVDNVLQPTSCGHLVQAQGTGLPPLILESTPVICAALPWLPFPVISLRIDFLAAINTEQSCARMERKKKEVNTSRQAYGLTLYQQHFMNVL